MKNESKTTMLVWASDLSNFLKENVTADKIVIAGESVRFPELTQLLASKAFQEGRMTFFYATNSTESVVREKVEIWFLGQAYANGSKLIVYGKTLDSYNFLTESPAMQETPAPKKERKKAVSQEETKEASSIITEVAAGSICGEGATKITKKVSSCRRDELEKEERSSAPKKDVEITYPEDKKEDQKPVWDLKAETPKKERKKRTPKEEKTAEPIKNAPGTPTSGAKARAEVIKEVIMGSKLSAEDKKFFSTPGRLSMLEDVIKKSSRDTIKFQLHMMFGDKAGVIEETITDSWKDLEAKLS